MGKVQKIFDSGRPGAVTRSVDEIVISVRNASETEIPFGAPVFMTADGAVPFSLTEPQDFAAVLGFAVRVADKTPDTYPTGQFNDGQEGTWHPGDVMEVLVRGAVTVPMAVSANRGSEIYLRKADGKLVASPGATGSTIELTNVKLRNARDTVSGCAERRAARKAPPSAPSTMPGAKENTTGQFTAPWR